MSLFTSIFGGMLLTAVLYGAGRIMKLSNFWSAVAAAGLPSFVYLAYAMSRKIGLDTITLHVIAYPTVAVLLGMLNTPRAKRNNASHWAPRLLLVFFGFMLVVMGFFVYVAGQGLPPSLASLLLPNATGKNIHTGFAGVVEHAGDAAKGVRQHLSMEDRLSKLGWRVEVTGLTDLRQERPGRLSVVVHDRHGQTVESVPVAMEITRPGQGSPIRPLFHRTDGRHEAALEGLDSGTWVARLQLGDGKDAILFEHSFEVSP